MLSVHHSKATNTIPSPRTMIPASGSVFFSQQSPGKTTFPTGTSRMMEAVFLLGNAWIFPVTSGLVLFFPPENDWKSPGNVRQFPGWNTASMKSSEILRTGCFLVEFSDLGSRQTHITTFIP